MVSKEEVLAGLRGVRELLSEPKRWTTGWFANDAAGNLTKSNSPTAVCWCVLGACNKTIEDSDVNEAVEDALDMTLSGLGYTNAAGFNDAEDTTHADVLKLIDDTIARVEAQ